MIFVDDAYHRRKWHGICLGLLIFNLIYYNDINYLRGVWKRGNNCFSKYFSIRNILK